MDISIQLCRAPISGRLPTPAGSAGAAGASVEFRGAIRDDEGGEPIVAIEYEAYEEMAVREMRRILEELGRELPCLAVHVWHRLGIVPVGEDAICVRIAGRHRQETFALLSKFMDRLKQDVPIWKRRALTAPERRAERREDGPPGVEEVLNRIRAAGRALEPERVNLEQAAGRVLREAIAAPEDQPPFDRSAVDGFAVRLDDRAVEFALVDELRAGDWRPRRLEPGEAVRIATGAALPGDGLQVVMREDAQAQGGRVRFSRRGESRHIRFRGEDSRAGQVLLESGTVLGAGSLALLASLGQVRPNVTRLPRVLHVATGNEIVPPASTPERGQIRDSNSTLVRAFLAARGIEPAQFRAPEDRVGIEAALKGRVETVDLLLVSGGASVGEHDFTRALLEGWGFRVDFSRTRTRPGKPLIFARRGDGALAFGLPGNPLAHFVALNLFVRAALDVLSGLTGQPVFSTAVLTSDLPSGDGSRETLWPARVRWSGPAAEASPLRWSSSGDLTSLATANALLHIPTGRPALVAGTEVAFASTLTGS